MVVFKCKMCGGTIEFEQGATVGVCDSCGTKQTLPKTSDDTVANLFNRANNLRLKCEFDKAAAIYEKIIEQDDSEAEAHWGIVLCKYGIEYVDDPATDKKIPTCHRTLFEAVTADADYQSAIDYSDIAQQNIYETEAREIDRIQKDILAIVKNEKPFDAFICYKETDENGKRTQDSVIANDIYYQLTQEGFKVFYAAITLEDKLGQEYEPYIFAALNSAKVMLVVGTNPMYFNAVWVRNEWSRFLKLMKTDRKKLLIPCYKDMDAYELPEEFSHLQAQDMGKIGFINDITRGIKKVLIDDAVKDDVKETVVVSTSNANAASLLERAFLFLEDGRWQDANVYCEKVLDIEPKNAEAYLGKLMAELQVKSRKQLADCAELFDNRDNYNKVLRFGDEKLEAELRGYIAHINERNENERLEKEKAKEEKRLERKNIIDNIKKAIFEQVGSSSLKQSEDELVCEIELLKKEMNEFQLKVEKSSAVQKEIKALSERKVALNSDKATLGFFKRRKKEEIDNKIAAIERKILELQKEMSELKRYLDKYQSKEPISAMLEKKQAELDILLDKISSYSDVAMTDEQVMKVLHADALLRKKFNAMYPKLEYYLIDGANVGDTIFFGSYEQDNDNSNGQEDIAWSVLEKEDTRMLVISDKALDCRQYNTSYTAVTWETCSLRKWLNDTFLNTAFNSEEQGRIQNVTVSADKNPKYDTNSGNATTDKVFLLSIAEAEKYFATYEERTCVPTAYAIARGALTNNNYTKDGVATCWWWLRSPGNYQNNAANVYNDGSVDYDGGHVSNYDDCIRPALWLTLES